MVMTSLRPRVWIAPASSSASASIRARRIALFVFSLLVGSASARSARSSRSHRLGRGGAGNVPVFFVFLFISSMACRGT
jgi:hypothetical protein